MLQVLGGAMRQIVETCRNCESSDLAWEKDSGWLTGTWRYLRCQRCHDLVRMHVPMATLVFYGIALVAALWGWISIGLPKAR